MDENLSSEPNKATQPSRNKLTASSYVVEAQLDREWEERRRHEPTAQYDSPSTETKDHLS